jgi:hypothetical protein
MTTKFADSTTATSTAATSTRDKKYFAEPTTREATTPNAPTVQTMTKLTTVTTGTSGTADPYRHSAHKVVVKRYAIKHG